MQARLAVTCVLRRQFNLPRRPRSSFLMVCAVLLAAAAAPQLAQALSTRTLLTANGPGPSSFFGSTVSSADLNGDGYPDLIVGFPGGSAGNVWIYFGGPSGPHSTADVVLTGEASSGLGSSLSAGDVNGDGVADLIVGASGYSSSTGRVYVFYGGPTLGSKNAASADVILTGEASSGFGTSASAAGDVNGDGVADVIVGASIYSANTGRAYVFYGGPGLVSKAATSANVILTGETNSRFGSSVAVAGDLNGDGRADLIVGAPVYSTQTGRVYVFYGGAGLNTRSAVNADVILTGSAQNDLFGSMVTGAGDLNGDGLSDLAVGLDFPTSLFRVYVFYGGSGLVSKAAGSADVILSGDPGEAFGKAIAPAGDINGDGHPDLLVGAATGFTTNRAYVFFGGPGFVSKSTEAADMVLTGDGQNSYFGASVCGSGDVLGDGRKCVLVGETLYNGNTGRVFLIEVFPFLVTSPNGGERWMAGQPQTVRWLGHDMADISASTDGGSTWSLLESNVGGQASNSYTVVAPAQATSTALIRVSYTGQTATHSTSDRSDRVFSIVAPGTPSAANRLQLALTGNASGDENGYSVANIGDVNGDGYPDYAVGAPGVNGSTGAVYIYYGGPAAHTTPDVALTGEASGNQFGAAISAAGDVNGDGRADLIVGAYGYSSNTGRAYVFYGGAGLVSKSAAAADVILTGEAAGSLFGVNVATAGDVNGDGRSDLIVGAYGYSSFTGRAYVFLGGSGLISKNASSADVILSGESTNNYFGVSLTGAGDVNGDGRSDIAVGAYLASGGNGRVYVFYGGTNLVSKGAASADVILTGESGNLGGSIAAGDLNGDGYSDLVVSAHHFNAIQGRAYVFYGGPTLASRSASQADVILTGEAGSTAFGAPLVVADFNGDGWPDIAASAPGYASNTGRVYVFYGGRGLATKNAVNADATLAGEATSNSFGLALAGAGDVSGDGIGDLLVGAYGYASSSGRAYLYDFKRYVITSPSRGDTWNVGATKSVSWQGAEPADLWLSTDGGQNYTRFRSGVGGSARNSISLVVPHSPSRFARVKLTPASSTTGGSTESDSLFTIQTSIALLGLKGGILGSEGIRLTWDTRPGVGPEGIAGYRLYRLVSVGDATGVRLGPDLIVETSFVDPAGVAGSTYRLSGVDGLGEELELGRVTVGAAEAVLTAWPIPYRGGELHVNLAAASAGTSPGSARRLRLYDTSGRLVRDLFTGESAPSAAWDGLDARGRPVESGIYLLRAENGPRPASLKIVVLR